MASRLMGEKVIYCKETLENQEHTQNFKTFFVSFSEDIEGKPFKYRLCILLSNIFFITQSRRAAAPSATTCFYLEMKGTDVAGY